MAKHSVLNSIVAFIIFLSAQASHGEAAQGRVCKDTFQDTSAFSTLLERPIILLGELHGTEQTPSFALGLVCAALDKGKSVVFSLEMPSEAMTNIENPTANIYWNNSIQDGRTSQSMYALVSGLQHLQEAGAVQLILEDISRKDMAVWEQKTAEKFIAALTDDHTVLISLAGNIHNSRRTYSSIEKKQTKATGVWLKDKANVVKFSGTLPGTAWNCLMGKENKIECGANTVGYSKGKTAGTLNAIENGNYDYVYYFERLTASLPAVGLAKD
jgi:DNA-binding XRE family transcriptional regulator